VVSDIECSAGGWHEADRPFRVHAANLNEASIGLTDTLLNLSQGCKLAPTCIPSLPLRFCMSATMAVVLSGLQLKAMGGSFSGAMYLCPPDPHRNAFRGP
jgi:hypothetical protein